MALPVAAAIASAAVPALLRGGAELIGRGQRRRNMRNARNQADESRSAVEGLMGQFGDRSAQAIEEGDMTAEELYGRQMATARDRIASNVGAGRSAIQRSTMASGGDVTGRSAAAMLSLTQQGNEAEMDVTNAFQDRADANRRFSLGRADNLLAGQTNIQQNLNMQDMNELNAERTRQMQRRQALNQLFSDLAGAGLNFAGQAA